MDILTLLKANIRYRKGSFISVLILSFIISICLTSIISININISKRADQSLKQNGAGDMIPIIWDVNCPDTMLQKIENNKEVDHVNVVKSITQLLTINKVQLGSSTFFIPYDSKKLSYQIYREDALSFQGNPKELKTGEIFAPISFERLYDCKIGDTAYLKNGNRTESFIIKGFFEEPLLGCEAMGIKLALMNEEDFNKLYAGRLMTKEEREKNPDNILGYYFVNIFQSKNSHMLLSNFRRTLNEESGIMDYALFSMTKEQSKSVTLMFAQIISGIMLVFVILLFAVILIVVGHSISTGIELDYTNLGILKAIGFNKNKLRQVFIFEYILAELAGFMIGMIGSIPAVYYLNIIFVRMTGLLSSVRPAFVTCLMLLAAVLLFSAIYVFVKTGAIAKVSPVRAISGGRDSIYYCSRAEIPIEENGLHIRMAFRQLTSNARQYISSTIIVALLVYFLVTVTLLGTSFNDQTIEDRFGVMFSDVAVDYNPKNDRSREEVEQLRKQVEADIADTAPISEAFKISTAYLTINGDNYHVSIYEDPTLVKSVIKGRAPLYDNEIAITKIVSDELGRKIGDTVTVENDDMKANYIISGLIQSTNDMGKETILSYEGVKKLSPDYYIDFINYKLKSRDKSAEVVSSLIKKYGETIDAEDENAQEDFGDTIINAMTILNFVIYTISILFAFIVILIVCGKVFLKERMDYGIYKALGFTTFSLRLQFALRFAMVALIGGLLGLGLNLWLNNAMMSVLLRNVGITRFESDYNAVSILLPIAVLTACFFLFAYLISGRIKRVDTKNLICND